MLLHPRAVGSKLKLVGGSTAPGPEGARGCQVRAPSCAAKGVAVWRALVAASDNLPRRFRCPGCSRTWLSWRQPGPVECFWQLDNTAKCAFCSQFYEPEALLSDPADGRIFIELLGE